MMTECDPSKPSGNHVFVQPLRSWDVHVKSKGLDRPHVVPATGTDPDDALTDCERRGVYFPTIGDRILRILERKNRHPLRTRRASANAQ